MVLAVHLKNIYKKSDVVKIYVDHGSTLFADPSHPHNSLLLLADYFTNLHVYMSEKKKHTIENNL